MSWSTIWKRIELERKKKTKLFVADDYENYEGETETVDSRLCFFLRTFDFICVLWKDTEAQARPDGGVRARGNVAHRRQQSVIGRRLAAVKPIIR